MAEEAKQEVDKFPNSVMAAVREWPRARKFSFAAVALLCLMFFGLIIAQTQRADYRLLFANLPNEDAGAVVSWLNGAKIPYQLEDGGKEIHIPADKVYETRLELAGIGLPQGGGVGFEIFDKQSFGLTDFAQKVNYRRAMQGELARTIASLGPVEAARVHLALPEKRVFKEQQQAATASVILKLVPGRQLAESQVQGIVNLVAGSVEDLEMGRVTVIDSSGRVLSKSTIDGDAGPMVASKLDYQSAVETRLEARAQSLLDRALGTGNSLVQVTAALDFSQRERLEESYDPERSAVRSEQASEEKGGTEMVGGVPGAKANLGDGQQERKVIPNSRTDETTNYEISKVVSKLVAPVGEVKNISVSVLVADRLQPAGDGGESSYVPRSVEELASIETMVRSALGLNDSRGDQISVVSRTFERDFFAEDVLETSTVGGFYEYLPFIKFALLGLGALLIYFLLVRPMVKTMRGESKRVEHYKTVEELESELTGKPLKLTADGVDMETMKLRQEITQSPTPPAQVIKAWLNES